jgi:hypothetical protein
MIDEPTITILGWCHNCQHQVPSTANKLTPATKRVWCPTWLGSQRGPINVCEECAKVFTSENKYSRRNEGSFHWGDDADKAFAAVELNLPKEDGRYENARGMAINGTQIARHIRMDRDEGLYVVDGKVWLVAHYNVLRLGSMDDARATFPKLFVSPPRRVHRDPDYEYQTMPIPNSVKTALEGKEFETDLGYQIRLSEVTDYIACDRSINIPNSYAVCRGVCLREPSWNEFIVYDNGEVCNGNDQRIGYWNDCPLISNE